MRLMVIVQTRSRLHIPHHPRAIHLRQRQCLRRNRHRVARLIDDLRRELRVEVIDLKVDCADRSGCAVLRESRAQVPILLD